jgi:hypothetical protein
MPTTEGDTGGIELLEGASNLDAVEDYKIIKDDLFAGLLIPKSYLSFEEDLCLVQETMINTSEGKISIKDLAENFEKKINYKVYVLSSDNEGFITYGKVKWCKPTRQVNTIYRVHLTENKGYVDCTDNHPFLLEDLTYVRADELKIGHQLKNIYEKDIRVEKVEILHYDELQQMYDLEVEKHHNFSLDVGGIFVHNSNKAALSQEDLRFNNAVKQYQSYFVEGLLHVGLVHLYMNGHSKDELESFELTMNSSSTLAEKVKNELLQQRIDLAKSALDNSSGMSVMSYTQVLKDILKFSDEQIAQTFKNQLIEKKLIWRLKQLEENGFYEEPDPDKKKAKMAALGLNTDDIFKNLKFESAEQMPGVERILKEQIDTQIKHLTKQVSLKPSKEQVERVIDLQESKVKRNIKKTFIDLGMNGNDI